MKVFFKRLLALALICVLAVSVLASCTVTKKYPGAPDGMRPVNDGSNGVIMYIPSNWSVDNSSGVPTAYFSFVDDTTVSLITVPAAELEGKTIQQYFEEYKTKFEAMNKEFTIIPYSSELEYTPIENPSLYGDIMLEYRYTLKISDSKTYGFAQTFFKTSENSDLYVITYSSPTSKFETHYSDVVKTYTTIKVVTEVEPLPEDDELPKPIFTTVEGTPEGYSAIAGEHIDYVLFVPSDWVPLVNTGITAASKGDNSTVSCSVTAFAFQNNDYYIDAGDYDSFFAAHEQSIKDTFGNISFADADKKYEKVDFAGYTKTVKDANENDVENPTAPRKYVYSIEVNGISYTYEQYVTLRNAEVVLLTFSCKSVDYEASKPIFDGIAQKFKFTK